MFIRFLLSIVISMIAFSVNAATHYTPPAVNNLIIFGDSLSDAGNPNPLPDEKKDVGNNYWTDIEGFSKDDVTPQKGAPITSMNQSWKMQLMWPNYFIQRAFKQTQLFPSSQARQLKLNPAFYHVDYAWASAETGSRYLNDVSVGLIHPYDDIQCESHGPGLIGDKNTCVPGVLRQVQIYLNDMLSFHEATKDHRGIHLTYKNSLYVIWAGGNDIFNNFEKILKQHSAISDYRKLFLSLGGTLVVHATQSSAQGNVYGLSYPVANIFKAKNALIKAGVSPNNIYVIGLPDLAKSPAAVNLANNNKTYLKVFSLVSSAFNLALKAALCVNTLAPNTNLPFSHVLSVESLLSAVASHPGQYHDIVDTNAEDVCLPAAWPYCRTGDGYYLWFNDKHPTTQAHMAISDFLYEKVFLGK